VKNNAFEAVVQKWLAVLFKILAFGATARQTSAGNKCAGHRAFQVKVQLKKQQLQTCAAALAVATSQVQL
jgi:hypothetical protein